MFTVFVRPWRGRFSRSVVSRTPPPAVLVTLVTCPTLTPWRTTAVPAAMPCPAYGVLIAMENWSSALSPNGFATTKNAANAMHSSTTVPVMANTRSWYLDDPLSMVARLSLEHELGFESPQQHGRREIQDHDGDQTRPHRPARRLTDSDRPTRGEVALVAMDQSGRDAVGGRFDQRVEEIYRRQELDEVVIVGASGFAVEHDHHGLKDEERRHQGEEVTRNNAQHPADQAGTADEGYRPQTHGFDGVDLLRYAHGPDFGRHACPCLCGESDPGDQRSDHANGAAPADETRQRAEADDVQGRERFDGQ